MSFIETHRPTVCVTKKTQKTPSEMDFEHDPSDLIQPEKAIYFVCFKNVSKV